MWPLPYKSGFDAFWRLHDFQSPYGYPKSDSMGKRVAKMQEFLYDKKVWKKLRKLRQENAGKRGILRMDLNICRIGKCRLE